MDTSGIKGIAMGKNLCKPSNDISPLLSGLVLRLKEPAKALLGLSCPSTSLSRREFLSRFPLSPASGKLSRRRSLELPFSLISVATCGPLMLLLRHGLALYVLLAFVHSSLDSAFGPAFSVARFLTRFWWTGFSRARSVTNLVLWETWSSRRRFWSSLRALL
jgi:hypothetical protein